MTIRERVKMYTKYKGITIKEFEVASGLSNGYISSMRKGIGIEKLYKVLAAFPDLNRDWLLYEEGDMLKDPSQQITIEGSNIHNKQVGDNNTYNERPSNDKNHDENTELRKLLLKQSEQIDRLLAVIEKLAAK